jgi:hypothetical protein
LFFYTESHNFTVLKRTLLIFFVLIGLNFNTLAQTAKPVFSGDPGSKVLKFYPNPAITTVVTFEFMRGYDKSHTFQLYNFMGKKVLEIRTLTPKFLVSLADLFRGVYIYQLRDKNSRIVESGKIQVVK